MDLSVEYGILVKNLADVSDSLCPNRLWASAESYS
jgi:hypothetical protein